MSATTRDRADYSLGVDDTERARLLGQCALHRAEAGLLLDRIGLRTGDRALDLGCGPLGVLDLLAERVGAGGRVVGLDREARYLSIARQELDARGLAAVALRSGDATATGLRAASFDLVHERLVLNNVPDPEAVVAEMVRLTRPDGHVAVEDVDWMTWTCLPEHTDWHRLADAVGRVWSGDVHIGRRLPALLRAGGLVDVQVLPPPARPPAGRALPPAAAAVRRAAPRARPGQWRPHRGAARCRGRPARGAPGRSRHRHPLRDVVPGVGPSTRLTPRRRLD
jgi:SAM-dependent methyltransferase